MPQSAVAPIAANALRTSSQSAVNSIPATSIRTKSQSAVAHIEASVISIFEIGDLIPEGRNPAGQTESTLRFNSWNTYTPTCSWSNVNPVGIFRIIGDTLELRLSIQLDVGSTPIGNLTFTLPVGLMINQNLVPDLVEFPPAGQVTLLGTLIGPASYDSANNLVIIQGVNPTYPFTWGTDDALEAFVKIPVEL